MLKPLLRVAVVIFVPAVFLLAIVIFHGVKRKMAERRCSKARE